MDKRFSVFDAAVVGSGSAHASRFGATSKTSAVTLTTGTDRRGMVYDALKPFKDEVRAGINNRQVVIKVNMGQVDAKLPLNATHPDAVRGILDFLKPIYKHRVILAEATAAESRSTLEGFKNFGYLPLEKDYSIEFVDLNERPTRTCWILGEKNHPQKINIIQTYLDPGNYLISVTRLKTHDNVFATLTLKNVVMGSPVNHWRQRSYEGRNEKPMMHSGGNRGLSYNLFRVAEMGVRPDLAVLDGVVGMEGNGPVSGPPIDHGVVLAGTDWLAVDRMGVELMGIDYRRVIYLRWCGQVGMGQDDRSKIEIIGPDPANYVKTYKLHRNIAEQLAWIEQDKI
ncbi:MAG: DUF362 domain-containing protein [Candidatus Latescibacter sp.]|nr:DUF362 domain-containing protein [Candidatus Latescibacter sp.]